MALAELRAARPAPLGPLPEDAVLGLARVAALERALLSASCPVSIHFYSLIGGTGFSAVSRDSPCMHFLLCTQRRLEVGAVCRGRLAL